MNNRDQLMKEMDLAFEILENLIRQLPVTVARQDELSTYATQLMEKAYQAGKAQNEERGK